MSAAAKYPIDENLFCFSFELFCFCKYSLKSFAKSLSGFLMDMPENWISAPPRFVTLNSEYLIFDCS